MMNDNLPFTGEELNRVIVKANREFDEYVASGRYAEDQARIAGAVEESMRASEEFLASDEYKATLAEALAATPTPNEIEIALSEDGTPSIIRPQDR